MRNQTVLRIGSWWCATVDYKLEYESNDFFPKHVVITNIRKAVDISPDDHNSDSSEKLKVGMYGQLEIDSISAPVQEEFFVKVLDIAEGEREIIAEIIKPTNFPICLGRRSIESNPDLQQKASNERVNQLKWEAIITLVGLESSSNSTNIWLDDNTCIVSLDEVDRIEIQHYRYSQYRESVMLTRLDTPPLNAICFQKHTGSREEISADFKKILMAFRLFDAGYFEFGLLFIFNSKSRSNDTWGKPPYLPEYRRYNLKRENIQAFKDWLVLYKSQSIIPGSLIARALSRFERTYEAQEVHERITDAVIGLETLLGAGQKSEINYRVSQS